MSRCRGSTHFDASNNHCFHWSLLQHQICWIIELFWGPSGPFRQSGRAGSRASLHTDKCLKLISKSCYRRLRRLLSHQTDSFLIETLLNPLCIKASDDVADITTSAIDAGFSGCSWGPNCVLHFFIYFGVLWTLMNPLLLRVNLSISSPEKRCKINPILPMQLPFFFSFFFGQLDSKSVLSQRSINLPNRRSHSSRTKTRRYQTNWAKGLSLNPVCALCPVVVWGALTVWSPWRLLARQRLLPVSLSFITA